MRWYVRGIDEGWIWGPMSEEEANDMCDQMDDVVSFPESLFHPKIVMLEDVSILVSQLRDIAGDDARVISLLCRQAAEMIVNLSREKQVTGTIHGGVLELDHVDSGIKVDIRDYDVAECDNESLKTDEDGHEYIPHSGG